ncbi:MAG: MFS transporter [Betaproteobacteria bacterium]|nr:MFS transporter [Betaproteobacteria bacterium]
MAPHLLLIGAAGFISIGTFRLTDPLLPAIASDFGATVGSVAQTVTAFMLGYGLLQLLYGPLGDRLGKLRVMGFALALCSVATMGCAATGSVAALAALRFLGGMTAGAMVPLSMAHIGDTVPYETRQATIGHYLSATIMGQIVGGSLAGMFAEFFGWRLVFVLFGAAGLIVAARLARIAARTPPPAPRPAGERRPTPFSLLALPDARIVWGAVFLEGTLVLGVVPYAGAYLRYGFDLDYFTIGLVLGSFGVGGLVFSALVRLMIARLGERGMIATGGTLVVVSYCLLALAPVWQIFIPALALVGMGFFTMHNPLQVRATELAPHARGTAMSGFSFSLFLGQGVGVFAISFLVDGPGYRIAYGLAAAGVVLLAFWIWRTAGPRRTAH